MSGTSLTLIQTNLFNCSKKKYVCISREFEYFSHDKVDSIYILFIAIMRNDLIVFVSISCNKSIAN